MDMKKLIGAIVAAFVILFVAGFLVHGMWLGTTYRQMRDAGFSFRPEDTMRHKLWGVWVSDALYSILFVWIYAKGREEKPSRNSLWDLDDSLYRRAVNDQRLCCLQSAAYLGIALDDRWIVYADPDGPRRGDDTEEIQSYRSLIATRGWRRRETYERAVSVRPNHANRRDLELSVVPSGSWPVNQCGCR